MESGPCFLIPPALNGGGDAHQCETHVGTCGEALRGFRPVAHGVDSFSQDDNVYVNGGGAG